MNSAWLMAVSVLIVATPALADGGKGSGAATRPSDTLPADLDRLLIVSKPGAPEARLTIPRAILDARGGSRSAGENADASRGLSPLRTVVAGIALFAAISLAGLRLLRRRGDARVALFILFGSGVVSVLVADSFANLAPLPPWERVHFDRESKPTKVLSTTPVLGYTGLPVRVEIVEDGNVIRLEVDPAHFRQAEDKRWIINASEPNPVPIEWRVQLMLLDSRQ